MSLLRPVKIKQSIVLIVKVIFFAIIFIHPKNIAAQNETETTIAVSPAIIEGAGKKGSVINKSILVFNVTDQYLPVKIYVDKIEEDIPDSINSTNWVEIAENQLIIDPKSEKSIDIKIHIPEDAEAGGHYSTVYIETLSAVDDLSETLLGARIGIMVITTVDGEIFEDIRFEGINPIPMSNYGPDKFTLTFQNNGNVHALITGEITITKNNDETIYENTLNPTLILPGIKKEIEIPFDHGKMSVGRYNVEFRSRDLSQFEDRQSFLVFRSIYVLVLIPLTLLLVMLIMRRNKLLEAARVLFTGHT